jgi:hypothetical protein
MQQQPDKSWTREITFWYEGDAFDYAIVSAKAFANAEAARQVLYGKKATDELRMAFLLEVRLDMTRAH